MSEGKNHNEQFERYLKGELSTSEAHAFERENMDDAFVQEIVDYLEERLDEEDDRNLDSMLDEAVATEESRDTWDQEQTPSSWDDDPLFILFLEQAQLQPSIWPEGMSRNDPAKDCSAFVSGDHPATSDLLGRKGLRHSAAL